MANSRHRVGPRADVPDSRSPARGDRQVTLGVVP